VNPLLTGIVFAIVLVGCAILLRRVPTRSGAMQTREKRLLGNVLLAASVLILVVTFALPFAHTVPNSLTVLVERIVPKFSNPLHHLFRYEPRAGCAGNQSARRAACEVE